MKDKTLLKRTLKLLRTEGWIQGYSKSPEGAFCLLGAAYAVSDCSYKVDGALIRAVPGAQTVQDVTRWNDAPGRIFREVEATLEAAIAQAE